MKTLSFFTEKGGSGKTTFNIMFASYLCYTLGKRVCVIDFDFPAYHLDAVRKRELSRRNEQPREGVPVSYLSKRVINDDGIYEIAGIQGTDAKSVSGIMNFIRAAREKDAYDYMVFDFPGSLRQGDASTAVIREGLLDLLYMPVRGDMMEINAIVKFHNCLKMVNANQDCRAFFNFVNRMENQAYYDMLRVGLESFDVTVSDIRIPNLVAIKKENDERAFRSTLYFPDALVRSRAPEIIRLFDEIIER